MISFSAEYDECTSVDHGCEQFCINTLGGYDCACKVGFELHSDNKHCEGKTNYHVFINQNHYNLLYYIPDVWNTKVLSNEFYYDFGTENLLLFWL